MFVDMEVNPFVITLPYLKLLHKYSSKKNNELIFATIYFSTGYKQVLLTFVHKKSFQN
ncbi:hypothetical protein GGR31_001430 [Mesonia maritima]|uniref:Uncharacterized protein n=1 Tax=Mesonia maritima TaxID=1793873 RepID=A0ABU1K592_9FLAO|nr:hypothetical protein [Mesonia maritima]